MHDCESNVVKFGPEQTAKIKEALELIIKVLRDENRQDIDKLVDKFNTIEQNSSFIFKSIDSVVSNKN